MWIQLKNKTGYLEDIICITPQPSGDWLLEFAYGEDQYIDPSMIIKIAE